MGAWSHEPFGNDNACDWAEELAQSEGFTALRSAFDEVLGDHVDYVESDEGSVAIAAAEVLAKCLGRGTQNDAYTEKADAWVAAMAQSPDDSLRAYGVAALERVIASESESELAELWEEGDDEGDDEGWRESVHALIAILTPVP